MKSEIRHSGPGFHRDKPQPESRRCPPYQVRADSAKAGKHQIKSWIPAFAGMTNGRKNEFLRLHQICLQNIEEKKNGFHEKPACQLWPGGP